MNERPYVSFAEVKEKVPLPEVLQVFGIAEQFVRRGDSLMGICPFPTHKHGPSPNPQQFKIDRRKGVWLFRCFGDCQRGGDVVEFVKGMTGYDDAHVRFWFAETFGDRLTLTKQKPNGNGKKQEQVVEEKESAPKDHKGHSEAASQDTSLLPNGSAILKPLRFKLNLDPDVPYLRDRGLTDETIARFGLGLCRKGCLAGYVAIPVYGHPRESGANALAYLGRWPGDDFDDAAGRPRYKWPDGFPKSRVVYGLPEALHGADGHPLVVVEGPFSVFRLAQMGMRGAVAIFGSSLSDEQADLLASSGRRIVLLFDGDEAGQSGMRLAAAKLIRRTFLHVIQLPDGAQPDTVAEDTLMSRLSAVRQ